MNILSIVIILFIILEILNVAILYFMPSSKLGNGLGVFNAYEKSKKDPDIHALIKYLINWVAGTKMIFIALLIVILWTGDNTTKIFSIVALIISTSTFFWRLYPAIRAIEKKGQLTPKGYSKSLGMMLACIIGVFTIAVVLYLTVFSGN